MAANRLVLDVSNTNPISLARLRAAAPAALVAKASEGSGFTDRLYAEHRKYARQLGIPFGGYLFLHPGSSGNEAAHFLAVARPVKGDLQPMIDTEVRDGVSFAAVAARVDACAKALEARGYRPLLYSYTSFLQQLLRARPKLARLRVWQAGYVSKRPRVGHGASVVLWQFTDAYKVGSGRFDASRLYVPLDTLLIGS